MAVTPTTTHHRSADARGKRRPRVAVLVVLASVAALALAALVWPMWPVVRVTDQDTLANGEESTIGHVVLGEGEQLTITYVHSIDGLPIEENLEVRDGRLVADSTRLRQFGAGMGHIPGEGVGRADGEWWVIEDMNRDVGTELAIRIGPAAIDHRLRTPDGEIRLSPCLATHRVVLEPVQVSTLHRVFGRAPRPEC